MRVKPLAVGLALLVAACSSFRHDNAPAEIPAREFVVFFEGDSAALTDGAKTTVKAIADAAKQSSPVHVLVEGQSNGTTQIGATLAQKRALAVSTGLQEAGVPPGEIDLKPGIPAANQTDVAAHKVVVRLVPG